MESNNKTDKSTGEPHAKLPYRTPQVRKLGTVAELTLAPGSQPISDHPGSTTKVNVA
jgi:hypothetical protein